MCTKLRESGIQKTAPTMLTVHGLYMNKSTTYRNGDKDAKKTAKDRTALVRTLNCCKDTRSDRAASPLWSEALTVSRPPPIETMLMLTLIRLKAQFNELFCGPEAS